MYNLGRRLTSCPRFQHLKAFVRYQFPPRGGTGGGGAVIGDAALVMVYSHFTPTHGGDAARTEVENIHRSRFQRRHINQMERSCWKSVIFTLCSHSSNVILWVSSPNVSPLSVKPRLIVLSPQTLSRSIKGEINSEWIPPRLHSVFMSS